MWSCGRVLCARLYWLWLMVTFPWYRKQSILNKMVFIFSFSSITSFSYDGLDWPTKENTIFLKTKPCYYIFLTSFNWRCGICCVWELKKTTNLVSTARYTLEMLPVRVLLPDWVAWPKLTLIWDPVVFHVEGFQS